MGTTTNVQLFISVNEVTILRSVFPKLFESHNHKFTAKKTASHVCVYHWGNTECLFRGTYLLIAVRKFVEKHEHSCQQSHWRIKSLRVYPRIFLSLDSRISHFLQGKIQIFMSPRFAHGFRVGENFIKSHGFYTLGGARNFYKSQSKYNSHTASPV